MSLDCLQKFYHPVILQHMDLRLGAFWENSSIRRIRADVAALNRLVQSAVKNTVNIFHSLGIHRLVLADLFGAFYSVDQALHLDRGEGSQLYSANLRENMISDDPLIGFLGVSLRSVYKELHADRETGC